MGANTYTRRNLPPCPDPERYVLVNSKDGYFWRKKRGTVKETFLNSVMARNNATAKITGPAGSRIVRKLEVFTRDIKTKRLTLSISNQLMKTYHEKGAIDFSGLMKMEISCETPLDKILQSQYFIEKKKAHTRLHLPELSVKAQNKLVTDYFIEAVLVWGDATADNSLKVKSVSSSLFSFETKKPGDCELLIPLPPFNTAWMLLLKISCLEGNEYAANTKHFAMKVIATGN